MYTKYCDEDDRIVKLTEDGYCTICGKHADNMKSRAFVENTKLPLNVLQDKLNQ